MVATQEDALHTYAQTYEPREPKNSMHVIVNGESRALANALTIEDFLRDLGVDSRKVAVELNLEIVPKSTFGTINVRDGDRIEIVHFIGGG